MEAEKIGIYELYQKIKEYNMDFFPLNNEVYHIRLFEKEWDPWYTEPHLYLFNCHDEHVATIHFGGVDDSYLMHVRLNRYKYYFVFAYRTEKQYRNKGIMTEFVNYITSCIFMFYEKTAIFIGTDNIRSEKVAIKCGYQFIRYTYNYDGLFIKTDKTFKNIEYPKYNYIELDSKVALPKGNTPMLYKHMESRNFIIFNDDERMYFEDTIKVLSDSYDDFYVFVEVLDKYDLPESMGFKKIPRDKLRNKNMKHRGAHWYYKLIIKETNNEKL